MLEIPTYRFRDFRNSRDGVTPEEEFLLRGATVARVATGPEEGFKGDSAAIVLRDANGTEVRVTFPEKYLRYAYVVATAADPAYPEDRNRFDVDPGRTS